MSDAPLSTENDTLDAARYRWLRAKAHSLESQHGGGKSCYHKVGGIRELKSEAELDAAVDAAIEQADKTAQTIKQLMLYYSVSTPEDLTLSMMGHIERLQAQLPDTVLISPFGKVREG